MTVKANATKAMFNAIAKYSFNRIKEWFMDNPDSDYCYWAKDDFLPAKYSVEQKEQFMCNHPEIENLDDHTTVYYANGIVTLRSFCPKLREGIADMISEGYTGNIVNGIIWKVEPEDKNYKLIAYKEV